VPHIQLHLKFPKNKKTNKKGGFLVDSRMQIFSVNDIDLFTENQLENYLKPQKWTFLIVHWNKLPLVSKKRKTKWTFLEKNLELESIT
jgi:hypothetical protein